ncbi:MAG: phospholipid carrier-dependent glycosyltransferase, partial [Myxococcota bacterium]
MFRAESIAFAPAHGLLRTGGYSPAHLTFDEHHFVPNAQNYLAGKADTNDHPPLGKLLIASAIALFGDTAAIWRLPALLAGLLSIFLAYRLAARLFRDERAGWFAAVFVAVDGFFISYARTALLDGVLAMFMLASALFVIMYQGRFLEPA